MNIESTTIPTAAKTTAEASTSATAGTVTKDSTKTFKDELATVATQETQNPQTNDANKTQIEETNAKNNNAQQIEKDKLTIEQDKVAKNLQIANFSDPLSELNLKIASLNEVKNGFNQKPQTIDSASKTDSKTKTGNDYSQSIKMDNKDTIFFLNLVQNQQMSAQANQATNSGVGSNTFTDIKSEATQSTVQVSATLLNALNDSVKTGKSFRIDFDNDIAVIMKVDKEGTLSANFIPGSAAVEQYLKNNIAGLRQSFNEQNLPYNELSYRNQSKQEQKQQQNNKNKENENE